MAHITRAAEADTFTVQGNHMTRLVAPSTGASEVMAWRAAMDAGVASPPHRHDHEEIVVLLSGTLLAKVGETEAVLTSGDACLIPAHTLHQVINTGAEPCTLLIAMRVGTRFLRPDGSETPAPPWTT
jgi:quercetin dioxygenase-like cupin family protein